MSKFVYAILPLAFILFKVDASASPPYRGGYWRSLPSEELMREGWRRYSATGFGSVLLDMNGDGVSDEASLVVSSDGSRSAIRVCFGIELDGGNPDCLILAEGENVYSVMGLERREAGCHRFHEDDAGHESDGRVCSKSDALEYFRFGSSASFFIYDEKSRSFTRYWSSQ